MINEFKEGGSLSEQTSLEPNLADKKRGQSGEMSESTPLEETKSIEQMDSEIQAYKN